VVIGACYTEDHVMDESLPCTDLQLSLCIAVHRTVYAMADMSVCLFVHLVEMAKHDCFHLLISDSF